METMSASVHYRITGNVVCSVKVSDAHTEKVGQLIASDVNETRSRKFFSSTSKIFVVNENSIVRHKIRYVNSHVRLSIDHAVPMRL